MPIELMPSQKQLYEDMVDKKEKYFRRNNIILFGKQQIGKTELAKYMSQKGKNYKYVNFTKKHLENFILGERLKNIRFNDFQDYLRITFNSEADKNTRIILDEIDSVIIVITEGDSYMLSQVPLVH
jgi:predicted AAA+ superfamily ATPase